MIPERITFVSRGITVVSRRLPIADHLMGSPCQVCHAQCQHSAHTDCPLTTTTPPTPVRPSHGTQRLSISPYRHSSDYITVLHICKAQTSEPEVHFTNRINQQMILPAVLHLCATFVTSGFATCLRSFSGFLPTSKAFRL